MMKKLTSILLALVMALTLCTAAWADSSVIPSYDWFDNHTGTYTISSDADLLGFMNVANGTREGAAPYDFAGATITLANDIDLRGMTWTPIKSLGGEFNGNGKTISNFSITVNDTNNRGGLFNIIAPVNGTTNGKVHDLTISGVTATVGNGRFGTLANSVQGIVERVTVKNVSVTTTHKDAWVGGMCAFMSWPAMSNCTVENLEVDATQGAAFIAGFSPILQKNSNYTFVNLQVNGFKVVANDTDADCAVAGMVGQTQTGWQTPKMDNCSVTGLDVTASGTVDVGGFITWPGAHTILTNCSVQGKINALGVSSDSDYIGGFFGNLGWNCDLGQTGHKLTGCTADVDIISGGAPAGGFVGSATNGKNNSMYAEFTNCSASGDVTNENGVAGGFAGDADRGTYTNCTATGTVKAKTAGGFIGAAADVTPAYDSRYPAGTRNDAANQIKVSDCTSNGLVIGSENAGGLVGSVADKKSADGTGTNGQLIVANSSSTGTVVGTTSTTNVNKGINGSGSKLDSAASTGNTPTSTTVKGNNITVATDPNTNITVITAPAGTVVNGEAITEAERIDGMNGKVIPTMTLSAESGSMKAGKTVTFTYAFTGDGPVTATSSNSAVATVTVDTDSKTVTVTGVSAGSAIITVEGEETETYDGASAKYTVEVTRNHHRVKSNATPTETVESPKTFDAGIAVYGVMAVSSVLGMGYVGKKKF